MRLIRTLVVALACASVGSGAWAKPEAAGEAPREPLAAAAELPAPEGLSDDLAVWPNVESRANSDEWIWRNHERIRVMRPRVVVLNFANDVDEAGVRTHAEGVAKAFAEATRYHGYADPAATPFVQYEIVKIIDMRDEAALAEPKREISSRMPRKKDLRPGEPLIDYAALFSDEFAPSLGFGDPRTPGRFLNLKELADAGYVHEVWFYAIHDGGDWPGNETCENKQFYDEECRPLVGKHGMAGNGHDRTLPWIGRSFRVCFFNPHRGPGCSMENYGHTMEWIANSESNLYFRKYFYEFADFDLDTRGLSFESFYRTAYDRRGGDEISYPKPDKLVVKRRGKEEVVEPFVLTGGSAHFPPGARWHYDLESPYTVQTTLETYRTRATAEGKDEVREFTKEKYEKYKDVAPDCMGRWIVYWFQSMPGLENRCMDAEGKAMKNWWPFLFY